VTITPAPPRIGDWKPWHWETVPRNTYIVTATWRGRWSLNLVYFAGDAIRTLERPDCYFAISETAP
jgi:hypothetical protein